MPAETILRPLPAPLRDAIARRAGAVDGGAEDPRTTLRELAGAGLLTLGVPGRDGTVAEQAAVLAEIGGACMATAFCAWGHRMALEYLAPAGGRAVEELASLRRIGSSAMAGAFKAAAGIAPLPVRARRDRDGLVLHGRIAWASNLHDDTLAVLAVDVEGEGPLIVALPLSTPGVEVRPAHGLLALEATASGQVILDGAQVAEDAVHPEPFDAFITRVRRPFLVLQSAFCLGLARAALDAGEQCLGGLGAEFADDHAQLSDEYTRLEQALGELADDRDAPTRELLTLRLDAAALARDAGRVEAAVTGGRGYLAASPTARRLREAAFLPIQSPTEGHLRWELRRLG